jgi:hypothetical protein
MRNKHFLLMVGLTLGIFKIPFFSNQEAFAQAAPPKKSEKTNAKITVLIGVDGLSLKAFSAARQQGLFRAFENSSAHIAPFPTMTDLSWSTLTKTAEIFGPSGRIRSVEATYFDESTESIQGDPRDYYQRLAFPKYYLNAFQNFYSPYLEGLMYFPTKEMAKTEIDNVIDSILKSKESLITGYIGGVDSTAHTQGDRLFPVLRDLDAGLNRLLSQFAQRQQPVEVILVSDHGNVGRFREGEKEQELLPVDIKPILERAGFNSVQQLQKDKDVAIPLLALGTWAPVYLKNRQHIDALIRAIDKEIWFDMAIYLRRNSPTHLVLEVTGAGGNVAQVIFDKTKKRYYYQTIVGNPLELPEEVVSTENRKIPISPSDVLTLTQQTPYPDSIKRLVESASNKNFDFPDVILTLRDGYFMQNSLGSFTKMYRTHGSLSTASSLGILTSTQRALPAMIRTEDILPLLQIDPKSLFGRVAQIHQQTGLEAHQIITQKAIPSTLRGASPKQTFHLGVETESRSLSSKRIFQILSRFVADTRAFFVLSEFNVFLKALNIDPLAPATKDNLNPLKFNLSEIEAKSLITSEDIGYLTDVLLKNQKAPVEALNADPVITSLKAKFGGLAISDEPPTTPDPKAVMEGDPNAIDPIRNYLLPGRRGVMKLYQLPFLLERSLALPEKVVIPESRDLHFAAYWNKHQESFSNGAYPLTTPTSAGTVASTLFGEVLKEQTIEEKIYPTPLNKLYNRHIKELTIVYVPGIYNSLFDKELFALGLTSLKEEFGLRVLVPPVESICAADYNGDIILKYLKNDLQLRRERGFPEPTYLILGYSKGAVDTLHALTKDREFFSKQVLGLVSIASPLHGSSILDKTDLPFALVDAVSEKSGPEICRKEKPSGPSISPAAMDSFWRKNERSLVGLTRYFSLTFKSEAENSHLFMKATKLIAQFDEDNDGVVTVSSSKFPSILNATDLGTIEADHLAGVLSSKFDQKSFLRAIINTMAEFDIENRNKNLSINTKLIANAGKFYSGKERYRLSIKNQQVQLQNSLLTLQGVLHPLAVQAVANNTAQLNKLIIPESNDPASTYQTKIKLPSNQLKYDPYQVLDVQKLSDIVAAFKVTPTTPENALQGIQMDFDHQNMVHFRMDHQLLYESRSPLGLDDNAHFGYKPTNFQGENYLLMRSKNNSIRLTTLAYRFKPLDFSQMQLKLAVTKGVQGADPVLGGAGRDDSAFQVWFTIRYGDDSTDRTLVDPLFNEVILFGYYWGDPAPDGEPRKQGQIFENWYSKKNVVVATLPESKQLLLNDQTMLGQVQEFHQHLYKDLQRAFPDRDVNKMEIVAITIQHDSNDAEDSSEAYFKHLRFLPSQKAD